MKTKLILMVFLLPWAAFGSEANVEHYVAARTALLEAQVENLRTAVDFLQQGSLSDQDLYELVGEPGFATMEASLAAHGFTVKTFYEYQAQREGAIEQWLAEHQASASRLVQLEGQRQALAGQFEQLSQTASQDPE